MSLTIANGRLYVVNRGDEVQGQAGTIAPTITVFNIGRNGVLTEDWAATTTLPVGLSPSQLLISSTSRLAFLDTFTPPPLNNVTDANEVLPFQIAANGALIPVSSGGVGGAGDSAACSWASLSTRPKHHLRRTGRGQSGRRLHVRWRRQSEPRRYCCRSKGKAHAGRLVSAERKIPCILSTPPRTASACSRWPIPCTPFRSRNSCWAGHRIRPAVSTAALETTDFEFALEPERQHTLCHRPSDRCRRYFPARQRAARSFGCGQWHAFGERELAALPAVRHSRRSRSAGRCGDRGPQHRVQGR